VYPPVDTAFYRPNAAVGPEPFLLAVSALAPYKRLDLAIRAAAAARLPLTIVGRGPEEARLRAVAATAGGEVRFAGWLSDEDIRELYRRCRAVVMPGVEDFGMVPVEAQACGRPVVALAEGGALDSVIDGVTGLLVRDASVDAFAAAFLDAARRDFDPAAIRRHAESFGKERFQRQFQDAVEEAVSERRSGSQDPREIGARPGPEPDGVSNAATYGRRRRSPADREAEQ
jgi:glycosyltransferase involved in cell wall biosynthesis